MHRSVAALTLLIAGAGSMSGAAGDPPERGRRALGASLPSRLGEPARELGLVERPPSAADEGLAREIPFCHRVGDCWRLVLERRVLSGGVEGAPEVLEQEARIVSPLGRDFLVELIPVARAGAGTSQSLRPRTAACAALLDALGGGCLQLRVDRTGSAVELLNGHEARRALERARGAALPADEWPAAQRGLLAGWNTTYRACGVPLVPGRLVTSEIPAPGAVGQDRRFLTQGPGEGPEAGMLTLSALTTWREEAEPEALLRELLSTRFDPARRLLAGTHLEERRAGRVRTGERISFREEPLAAREGAVPH